MIPVFRASEERYSDSPVGGMTSFSWGHLAVTLSEGEVIGSAPGVTPSDALAGLAGEMEGPSGSSRPDRPSERRLATHSDGSGDGPVVVRLEGTPFQLEVWEALMGVPCGSVVTYSELASGIQRPRAVRAVASACAANRLGLIVPCHRVVRSDGSLGGYRWGEQLKRDILEAERACGQQGPQAEAGAVSLRAA